MKKPRRKRLVELEDPRIITDAMVIQAFGGKCFICKEPAIGILSGTIPGRKTIEEFRSPEMQSASDLIRSQFGGNMELPVCEAHSRSGLKQ